MSPCPTIDRIAECFSKQFRFRVAENV